MKIAVNTRFLLKNKIEGIGRVTYELLKRMVINHPEDEFIFFFDRPFDESFIFGNNVKGVVLSPPARHATLIYYWFQIALPKALKKYQPDVFFSPDNFMTLKTDIKKVIIVHDIAHQHFPDQISFFNRQLYNRLTGPMIQQSDRVITVSHYTKNDIIRIYGIPEDKIKVAWNGCDKKFRPIGPNTKRQTQEKYAQGKEYCFYVGAIHPRKNVHRLIEAFDHFKQNSQSDLKLLIAGRYAWQTGPVKSAYENAEFKEDIEFLGRVEDSQLYVLLAAAKMLIYLSIFEGFGLPILEAMNCDVPVICSNVTSLPEVAGEAGILVDPNNVEEVSKAIMSLHEEETLRQKLIEAGKEQRIKFSWDVGAKLVYQQLKF